MKVIKFPGAAHKHHIITSKGKSREQNVLLRAASFTCSGCGHTSEIVTNGMIFRSVDFYCDGCGSYFKIVNPAFALSIVPKKH